MMTHDRLVKTNGTYITWTCLIAALRIGAEDLNVGELSMGDAHDLVVSAKVIENRLREKAACDAKGGG